MLDRADVKDTSLAKVVFDKPYDGAWFCANHEFWAREQDLKMSLRSRAKAMWVFAGWQNAEVHSIPIHLRHRYYVAVPNFWGRLEPSRYAGAESAGVRLLLEIRTEW